MGHKAEWVGHSPEGEVHIPEEAQHSPEGEGRLPGSREGVQRILEGVVRCQDQGCTWALSPAAAADFRPWFLLWSGNAIGTKEGQG